MSAQAKVWMGLAAALATALTACGGGTAAKSPSSSSSSGPSLPTSQAQLVAQAKQEGHLTFYTSLAGPVVGAIAQAFEKAYPGIKVSEYRAQDATLVSKALQEAQAGKNNWDVMETPAGDLLILQARGMLAPYTLPKDAQVPESLTWAASGGKVYGAADRVSYIGYGYNKTLVPAADVPKTLDDLLKPGLAGKVGIVSSTTGVRWVGAVVHQLGLQQAQAFLAKVKAQHWNVQSISGAAEMDLIAAGQLPSSVTIFNDHEAQQAKKGAPVGWIPLEPVVANVGLVMLDNKAPDPAAAQLFLQFLLGPKGQALLSQYHYVTPGEKVSFQYWVPERGITASQYQKDYAQWKQLFQSTFGQG
ncbi:MAG: extracellular solute-binding protein [Firmicutes bacterium]|nr:extracellular solute-binding protein [Bacillota bacterium]